MGGRASCQHSLAPASGGDRCGGVQAQAFAGLPRQNTPRLKDGLLALLGGLGRDSGSDDDLRAFPIVHLGRIDAALGAREAEVSL